MRYGLAVNAESDIQDIENEFVKSWEGMEQFYQYYVPDVKYLRLTLMLDLIAELRKRGHDRQLRAGQQLLTFVLSRSRKHGLRSEQARLALALDTEGGMSVYYHEPPDIKFELKLDCVEVTSELEELLAWLLKQPID